MLQLLTLKNEEKQKTNYNALALRKCAFDCI